MWLVREANHSHPSSAEVKECVELCFHSPTRLHGGVANQKRSTGTTLHLPLPLLNFPFQIKNREDMVSEFQK
jgi:hypothetical protein